jgi:hypothetical protein
MSPTQTAPPAGSTRKTFILPNELLDAITEWRSVQRPLPTEGEAVRTLLERALAAESKDQPEQPARQRRASA